MSQLFVYGTLKSGFRANHYLASCKFLGEARTSPDYQLHRVNWFPGMVRYDDAQAGVSGELYEVTEDDLEALDRYEGAPYLFTREEITLSDGRTAIAYLFNRETDDLPLVKDGVWKDGRLVDEQASDN